MVKHTMSSLSNKVCGAVNHGPVHHLNLPIFQRAIKSFVVNLEVISVVRVQIIPRQIKKMTPILPPQAVAQRRAIPSTGRWTKNLSMENGVIILELTAIGLQHQAIVNHACPVNTPMSWIFNVRLATLAQQDGTKTDQGNPFVYHVNVSTCCMVVWSSK